MQHITFNHIKSHIISKEILRRDDIEEIGENLGNRKRMESFLDYLHRKDTVVTYPKFIDIMKNVGKHHVVQHLNSEYANISDTIDQ